MKKPTSKIREEIARLQDRLKQSETRDAERIGRIALKAGLGEIEINEGELQSAFEEVAKRFRGRTTGSTGKERAAAGSGSGAETAPNGNGSAAGQSVEA